VRLKGTSEIISTPFLLHTISLIKGVADLSSFISNIEAIIPGNHIIAREKSMFFIIYS
jgi:hypothetical protein